MRDSLNLEDLQAYVEEKQRLERLRTPRGFGLILPVIIIIASRYMPFGALIFFSITVFYLLFGISRILTAKRMLPSFFRARKILAEILPNDQIHRIIYTSIRYYIVGTLAAIAFIIPFFIPSPIEALPSLQIISFPLASIGILWLIWRSIANWQALQPHDKQETIRYYRLEFIRFGIALLLILLGNIYFASWELIVAILLIYFLTSSVCRWLVANWIRTQWIWKELERTGNHDKALKNLKATRKFAPHRNVWDETIASILFLAGRYSEAQKAFLNLLIKRQQENTGVLGSIVARIAYCQEMQGKFDDALRHWEAAIEIEPDNYLRYGVLAEFYLYQQIEPERALELMEFETRHLKEIPPMTRALHSWVLAANGRKNEAEAQIQLIPSSVDNVVDKQYIYYCLGWTHYYLGNREAAKASFDRAIMIDSYVKMYADKAKQSVEQLQLS
jgi:tetratricopeptide (TPR) repeat protein